MGVLYKPFAILTRILSRRIGRELFANVWARVGDGDRPPAPNAGRRSVPSVFGTAALEAAVLAGVGAVMDQLAARFFYQLFGAWPGRVIDPTESGAEERDGSEPRA